MTVAKFLLAGLLAVAFRRKLPSVRSRLSSLHAGDGRQRFGWFLLRYILPLAANGRGRQSWLLLRR